MALSGGTHGPHATAAPIRHTVIHSSLLSIVVHRCASLFTTTLGPDIIFFPQG